VLAKGLYPWRMRRRHELTDAQWERLQPLLPPQRPVTGRPAHDHRTIVNAILRRLKTGAPWRDLPERYGAWQTVYARFRRWQGAGVWDRVLAALHTQGDAAGDLDWTLPLLDGTTVRAYQSAAGAQKGAAIRRLAAPGVASRQKSSSAPSGGEAAVLRPDSGPAARGQPGRGPVGARSRQAPALRPTPAAAPAGGRR
jgi:transposase